MYNINQDKKITILAIVCCFILVPVCIGCCKRGSNDIQRYFEQPYPQQRENFQKHTLEEQYEIYMYAVIVRHPPNLEYADLIATNGDRLFPFIIDKIKMENSDIRLFYQVYIIERVAIKIMKR
jgi:hypothetical protein